LHPIKHALIVDPSTACTKYILVVCMQLQGAQVMRNTVHSVSQCVAASSTTNVIAAAASQLRVSTCSLHTLAMAINSNGKHCRESPTQNRLHNRHNGPNCHNGPNNSRSKASRVGPSMVALPVVHSATMMRGSRMSPSIKSAAPLCRGGWRRYKQP
jgi:hypothetical protein